MAEDLEDHIEQAQVAIEEPAPEQRRDHHGDDPRDQAEHLDEVGKDAVLAVHPECQQKADADGEERGDDGDLKGEQERLADADILEQADIITETDKVALDEIVQIIEAAVEGIKKRNDQQENEQQHGRRNISHRSELYPFFFAFHKSCPPDVILFRKVLIRR